jgi:hypothetical protein
VSKLDSAERGSGKPLVLVMSHDPDFQEFARQVLSDLCEVVAVRGKLPTLQIRGRSIPGVAVIDELPDRTPADALAYLSTRWPNIRAVFLTSSTDGPAPPLGPSLGTIVMKPVVVERLRTAVTQRLRLAALSAGVVDLLAASGIRPAVKDSGTPRS